MTKTPKAKKEDTRAGKLITGELRMNNDFIPIPTLNSCSSIWKEGTWE